MGKKYIVEIGRLERLYKAYVNGNGKPNLTWLSPEVDLTPYTEPDLEQVRKEAYEHGYKKCMSEHDFDSPCVSCDEYKRGLADAKCGYENGFENGMIVAWDAAKKIALMDTETSENVTGYFGLFRIMENLTPMQAIEKIRQYEQEKKEQIQVGDEVRNIQHGWTAVVSAIDRECMTLMDTNGKLGDGYDMNRFIKTGRHFHEIAAVLEQMRGEQDG